MEYTSLCLIGIGLLLVMIGVVLFKKGNEPISENISVMALMEEIDASWKLLLAGLASCGIGGALVFLGAVLSRSLF